MHKVNLQEGVQTTVSTLRPGAVDMRASCLFSHHDACVAGQTVPESMKEEGGRGPAVCSSLGSSGEEQCAKEACK